MALFFQLFYQFMENRDSSIKCSNCFEENGDEKKVNQFLHKHKIYICGNVNTNENIQMCMEKFNSENRGYVDFLDFCNYTNSQI
jgi:Ca2+-binding EF-hand superfamily protein